MTRLEELAKDCIENHTHKLVDKPTKQDIYLREESIYISGYKEAEKQLIKAKEIIKRYVDFPASNDELWELHEEAERFLKEDE